MERRPIDYPLLIITLLLLAVGVMMVYSSSAIFAQDRYQDSYYFLKREVLFAGLGLALLLLFKGVNYHFFYKLVYPLLLLTFLLFVLVFIPGIGHKAGGAQRWIGIGPFTVQPSELAKFSIILYMAYALAKKKEKMKDFMIGFLP